MQDSRYVNDFLYAAAIPVDGSNALLWCAGVNLDRFNRITRGRHGQSSNPVVRGLQRVRLEVISLALSRGAAVTSIKGDECSGLAPVATDTWYAERLRIEQASAIAPDDLIASTVMGFLEKIALSGILRGPVPERLPVPAGLQAMFEGLASVQ